MSGREEKYRQPTKEWIDAYFTTEPYLLYMRQTGDMRKDTIIKREIYDRLIQPYFNVYCVVDDRASVVRMWDSLGLEVIRVGRKLR